MSRDDIRVHGHTPSDYSMAMSVPSGRLVFVAGQVALDDEGTVLYPGDVERQARHAFQGIKDLVESAGGTLGDVVKITTFFVDMRTYPEFAKVRREFFGDPFPTSTAVEVSALLKPGVTIEIEAIAVLGE